MRRIVAPSVAKADFLKLEQELQGCVDAGCEWLHWSVQDGRMVPKISFGSPVIKCARGRFPDTVFDVKLGVVEPERRVDEFVEAGADALSVHPESTTQLAAVLQMIRDRGVAAGVVLNPATPVAAVEPVLDLVDVVVVMLVSPGFGGPKYVDGALAKCRALRALKPGLHVTVDGGVEAANAGAFLDAGANVLVAGGAVFKAAEKRAVVRELLGAARPLAP